MLETAALLRGEGIALVPHDGAAIGAGLDRFVYSTAVEAETPEWRAARALEIPMLPRPALLAELVNAGRPGVAISGHLRQEHVTGLVAWLVESGGRPATVIGGAPGSARALRAGSRPGPRMARRSPRRASRTGPSPAIARTSASSTMSAATTPSCLRCASSSPRSPRSAAGSSSMPAAPRPPGSAARSGPASYGVPRAMRTSPCASSRRARIARGACSACPEGHLELDMPLPGLHNLENAAAAALVALELGGSPEAIEQALPRFPGLARRFEVVGVTPAGIRVVDDYAHNPEKIRAALTTAQAGCDRLVAVFQPHGFGPARFMRPDLALMLPRLLRPATASAMRRSSTRGAPWRGMCRAPRWPRTCRAPSDARWRTITPRWSSGWPPKRGPGTRCSLMGARDPQPARPGAPGPGRARRAPRPS